MFGHEETEIFILYWKNSRRIPGIDKSSMTATHTWVTQNLTHKVMKSRCDSIKYEFLHRIDQHGKFTVFIILLNVTYVHRTSTIYPDIQVTIVENSTL